MADLLFYCFAMLTVGSALLVVVHRNAVNSAMCLFLTFVGMAGLFVLLEAYFLAVLQVLVYAGAVVVLFVFIVMLLDPGAQQRRTIAQLTAFASLTGLALMVGGILWLFSKDQFAGPELPAVASGSSLKSFGYQLFTTYLLPMQLTGFLLLVAMIGVIVISKRSWSETEKEG